MQAKDINEISLSDATLSESNARLHLAWIESGKHPYLEYNAENTENIKDFTNFFINNHAVLDLKIMPYYTSQPMHIFRLFNWRGFAKVEGLIYSNGVVCLYDETTIRLWVHQDSVRLHGYHRTDIPPQPNMPQ